MPGLHGIQRKGRDSRRAGECGEGIFVLRSCMAQEGRAGLRGGQILKGVGRARAGARKARTIVRPEVGFSHDGIDESGHAALRRGVAR